MSRKYNTPGFIEYTSPEKPPLPDLDGKNTCHISLFSVSSAKILWVVPPTGHKRNDYQLGLNGGAEIARAAVTNPKLMAFMLSQAVIALPPERVREFETMLTGMFFQMIRSLSCSAAENTEADETINIREPSFATRQGEQREAG